MYRKHGFMAVLLAVMFAVSPVTPVSATGNTGLAVQNPFDTLVWELSNSWEFPGTFRNQGGDNVSYAFVTATLAEIALAKAGIGGDLLSPQYMRYAMSANGANTLGFPQAYNNALANTDGRNVSARNAVTAFLQRGSMGGMVLEYEDPYAASPGIRQASVTAERVPVYRMGDVIHFADMPSGATLSERNARINELKNAIDTYGAVGGWIYGIQTTATPPSSNSFWFEDKTMYRYSPGNSGNAQTANWCVALVGWDDIKEEFVAKNSWGDRAHGAIVDSVDERQGFFYLSYDDFYLLRSAFAVANPMHLGTEKIDFTYEYDPLGAGTGYEPAGANGAVWSSNIFTVTEAGQTARYVSFAAEVGVDYEVYLVTGLADIAEADTRLESLTADDLVATDTSISKTLTNGGYYTVKVSDDGIPLGNPGELFIVAVQQIGTDTVPVQPNDIPVNSASRVSANGGASWTELSDLGMSACIKVLAENDIGRPDDILTDTDAIIEIGSYVTLPAVVSGGGSNNLIWSSSDPRVASVDKNGVVTARRAGNCVITVRTAVGDKRASCAVEVPPILVTEIKLSGSLLKDGKIAMKTNQRTSLTAAATPSNASDLSVTWHAFEYVEETVGYSAGAEWLADDPAAVVTVNRGTVEGKNPGTAVIRAVSVQDGNSFVYAECVVTVEADYVTAIAADKKSVRLSAGSSIPVRLAFRPATAFNREIDWVWEDGGIAEVREFTESNYIIITGVSPGTAKLIGTVKSPAPDAANPPSVTIAVTVTNLPDIFCSIGKTVSYTTPLQVQKPAEDIEWKLYYDDMPGDVEVSESDVVMTTSRAIARFRCETAGEYRLVVTDKNNPENTEVKRIAAKIPVTRVISFLEGDEERKKIRRAELTLDHDGENAQTIQLYADVLPQEATYQDVTWRSSRPHVAIVNETTGTVTSVAPGTTVITAVSNSDPNRKASFSVTVKYNPQTLTLNREGPVLIDVTRSVSVKAVLEKGRNISKTVFWDSDDEDVATVKKGKIKAVGQGETTVTAMTSGGIKESVVVQCEILPRKITAAATKINLAPNGASAQITTSIQPANSTLNNVTYESGNSEIASVDENGRVTSGRAGSTTITVTTENGKRVRVSVVVK